MALAGRWNCARCTLYTARYTLHARCTRCTLAARSLRARCTLTAPTRRGVRMLVLVLVPVRGSSPLQWFYDKATKKLYLWANNTDATGAGAPPPPSQKFIATQLAEMVGVRGTMEAPVKDVRIVGVGFRDAASTAMAPWGVPSGGGASRHSK